MRKSTREYFDGLIAQVDDEPREYVDLEELFAFIPAHIRRNARRHVAALTLAYRVTRHLGPVGVFWTSMLVDHPGSLRNTADRLSCEYLGDFLFYGDPVTEDYYQSWVSKVRLPRWLHYHVGPRRDCTHA
jgi:hypothetical protein